MNTLKKHPILSTKDTLFYKKSTSVLLDFSASEISTDGSLVLLEKLERDHKLIKRFSKHLPDLRNPRFIAYIREAQLKQCVFMLMLGYEDANDITHYIRFENSMDKHSVFELCNAVLKKKVLRAEKAVRKLHLEHGEKHEHFISFSYQAQSWHKEQRC